jgi:outer membrane protein OmpA-like peptidoglycan-associated protein
VAPPAAQRTFNDIIFDFDRDVLRPDALPVLQQVLAALRADPALQFQIEGHASAEGTSEYNFALGERRAGAVRGYLIAQGIDAGRLSTISYGEERPRFENTSEANRAMNRRAAFVVRGQ